MALKPFHFEHLGAGMNDTRNGALLSNGESQLLRNLMSRGPEVVNRPGAKAVHATAWVPFNNEHLLGALAFKDKTHYEMYVGAESVFGRLQGNGFVQVPLNGLADLQSADAYYPWVFLVKGRYAYCVRRGVTINASNVGVVLRLDADTQNVTTARVTTPFLAPTVIDGGVGTAATLAGVYTCAYTFIMDNGAESNPSATTTVTLTAGHKRSWTIERSNHPKVVKRRLYVSEPDGAVLFKAFDVDNNIDGVASEETLQDAYGDELSYKRGLPPADPEHADVWQNRMWVCDGDSFYPSAIDVYEEFDPDKRITIRKKPNDAARAMGCCAWDGSRLALAKENSMHYLLDTGQGYRIEDISLSVGCASPYTIAVCEGLLVWYSGGAVYASDGGDPVAVSDEKMEGMLLDIPDAYKKYTVASVDEQRGLYELTIPGTSSPLPEFTLCWNFRNKTFHVRRYYESADGVTGYAPNWIGTIPKDGVQKPMKVGLFQNDKRVHQLDDLNQHSDNGTKIRCEITTGAISDNGNMIVAKRARLLAGLPREYGATGPSTGPPVVIFADIDLLLDGYRYTTTRSNVNLSLQRGVWTDVNVGNVGDPATSVQLHAVALTNGPLAISGVGFEVGQMARRGRAA